MKVLLITAAVLITAVPLVAHHGAATFDTEMEMIPSATEAAAYRKSMAEPSK